MERGEDYSELSQQLAQERARVAAQAEAEELKKIVDSRKESRDKAAKIQEKARLQGEAIDTFLEARDAITEALAPIIEKAGELPRLQGECYAHYHDLFQLGADMRQITLGNLPADFSVPMLEMASGLTDSYNAAAMGLFHLQAGLGFLSQLKKGKLATPQKPAGEFDGELDTETAEVELTCRVCNHEKAEEINKALKDGRSLRDIETEFNVSRSSLSRHKNRCLNLGAIRIRDLC